MDLAWELKNAVEHEDDTDTNCSWSPWNGPQKPGKVTEGTEDQRKNQDHLDPSIIKINWNPEKSPGDLRRLAVIQTCEKPPVRDVLKRLVWSKIIMQHT